jgi:hypothetical protein
MPTMTTPTQALRGRESYDPFTNPSDIHAEKVGRILIQHYSPTPRGLTLVKRNGEWEALGSVSHFELEAAELYYLGGHTHEVTLEIGQELVAAGMVTEVTDEEGRVSFEGVPDYRQPIPEEPEEEPEEELEDP